MKKVKISDIKLNPNNPRLIKDDKFAKLVQSVKDFPEMTMSSDKYKEWFATNEVALINSYRDWETDRKSVV